MAEAGTSVNWGARLGEEKLGWACASAYVYLLRRDMRTYEDRVRIGSKLSMDAATLWARESGPYSLNWENGVIDRLVKWGRAVCDSPAGGMISTEMAMAHTSEAFCVRRTGMLVAGLDSDEDMGVGRGTVRQMAGFLLDCEVAMLLGNGDPAGSHTDKQLGVREDGVRREVKLMQRPCECDLHTIYGGRSDGDAMQSTDGNVIGLIERRVNECGKTTRSLNRGPARQRGETVWPHVDDASRVAIEYALDVAEMIAGPDTKSRSGDGDGDDQSAKVWALPTFCGMERFPHPVVCLGGLCVALPEAMTASGVPIVVDGSGSGVSHYVPSLRATVRAAILASRYGMAYIMSVGLPTPAFGNHVNATAVDWVATLNVFTMLGSAPVTTLLVSACLAGLALMCDNPEQVGDQRYKTGQFAGADELLDRMLHHLVALLISSTSAADLVPLDYADNKVMQQGETSMLSFGCDFMTLAAPRLFMSKLAVVSSLAEKLPLFGTLVRALGPKISSQEIRLSSPIFLVPASSKTTIAKLASTLTSPAERLGAIHGTGTLQRRPVAAASAGEPDEEAEIQVMRRAVADCWIGDKDPTDAVVEALSSENKVVQCMMHNVFRVLGAVSLAGANKIYLLDTDLTDRFRLFGGTYPTLVNPNTLHDSAALQTIYKSQQPRGLMLMRGVYHERIDIAQHADMREIKVNRRSLTNKNEHASAALSWAVDAAVEKLAKQRDASILRTCGFALATTNYLFSTVGMDPCIMAAEYIPVMLGILCAPAGKKVESRPGIVLGSDVVVNTANQYLEAFSRIVRLSFETSASCITMDDINARTLSRDDVSAIDAQIVQFAASVGLKRMFANPGLDNCVHDGGLLATPYVVTRFLKFVLSALPSSSSSSSSADASANVGDLNGIVVLLNLAPDAELDKNMTSFAQALMVIAEYSCSNIAPFDGRVADIVAVHAGGKLRVVRLNVQSSKFGPEMKAAHPKKFCGTYGSLVLPWIKTASDAAYGRLCSIISSVGIDIKSVSTPAAKKLLVKALVPGAAEFFAAKHHIDRVAAPRHEQLRPACHADAMATDGLILEATRPVSFAALPKIDTTVRFGGFALSTTLLSGHGSTLGACVFDAPLAGSFCNTLFYKSAISAV